MGKQSQAGCIHTIKAQMAAGAAWKIKPWMGGRIHRMQIFQNLLPHCTHEFTVHRSKCPRGDGVQEFHHNNGPHQNHRDEHHGAKENRFEGRGQTTQQDVQLRHGNHQATHPDQAEHTQDPTEKMQRWSLKKSSVEPFKSCKRLFGNFGGFLLSTICLIWERFATTVFDILGLSWQPLHSQCMSHPEPKGSPQDTQIHWRR